MFRAVQRVAAAGAAAGGFCLLASPVKAAAANKERVGDFPTSGVFLKDHVIIDAYPDPKVEGVVVHVSTVSDARMKLKMFFTDPASSSITVSQVGPLSFKAPIDLSQKGELVLSESKNYLFKSTKCRRLYDETNNCLVYVSYSQDLRSDDRETLKSDKYRTSISSVPLGDVKPPDVE